MGPELRTAIRNVEARWARDGVKIDAHFDGRSLYLSKIVVPKEARGEGAGTRAMRDLVELADSYNVLMTLTPSTDFGGSSVERLKKFYKRFGFIENKGRNKDYEISASMYRLPKTSTSLKENVMRFPSINDVSAELRQINKQTLQPEDADEGIDVRLQVYPDSQWAVRSGSSDYDQDHRGYWGSSSVPGDNRRFDSKDIARDLIEQAREHKATGGDDNDMSERSSGKTREQIRANPRESASRFDGGDGTALRKFIENNVHLVGGEVVDNNSIDLDSNDEVSVAIVFNVTSAGRLPAMISATQGHIDSALEVARDLLEEWEQGHYGEDISTETFDARTWELSVDDFMGAIEDTIAEKYIDIIGGEDDEEYLEEEEEDE